MQCPIAAVFLGIMVKVTNTSLFYYNASKTLVKANDLE